MDIPSSDTAPTDAAGRLAGVETRLVQMEADRDFWRRQHDLVMADWKADCDDYEAQLAAARSTAAPPPRVSVAPPAAHHALLAELLQFYDPATGAVHGQKDGRFLFDAFARAYDTLQTPTR
jgi:hypothetical protein